MKTKKLTRAQKEALGMKKPILSDYEMKKASQRASTNQREEKAA